MCRGAQVRAGLPLHLSLSLSRLRSCPLPHHVPAPRARCCWWSVASSCSRAPMCTPYMHIWAEMPPPPSCTSISTAPQGGHAAGVRQVLREAGTHALFTPLPCGCDAAHLWPAKPSGRRMRPHPMDGQQSHRPGRLPPATQEKFTSTVQAAVSRGFRSHPPPHPSGSPSLFLPRACHQMSARTATRRDDLSVLRSLNTAALEKWPRGPTCGTIPSFAFTPPELGPSAV